ncbi:hypothetical protein KIV56_02555 [Cryobacterium breve]|uniref:Uncharacterized protein n=1 Tax=Cryobacterium breve TaxID=1259258 RepID=A0ABY7ND18_9MICO|nr:hypothetical protein [Cryobacterium breve]WBM80400.1 hypothetical protein KIV56_02555 [Cryobacterium breve]
MPIEFAARELANASGAGRSPELAWAFASMKPWIWVAVDTSELRSAWAAGSLVSSTNGTSTWPTSTLVHSSTAKPLMWSWWWWVATTTSRCGGEPAGATAVRSAMTVWTTSEMSRVTPLIVARP